MAEFIFKLPDLGEGVVEAEIGDWYVSPGDVVEEDQPIVDIMTDKASVEITSPVSGRVVSLAGEPGNQLAVGANLIVFETDKNEPLSAPPATKAAQSTESPADRPAKESAAAAPSPPATEQKPVASGSNNGQKPLTSPAVRRMAREAGIDLRRIKPSENGRILKSDLDAYLQARKETAPTRTVRTGTKEIPFRGLRRQIAKQVAGSARNIPHITYVEEVDVTQLESLRQHLNDHEPNERPRLTYLPFILQALVKALLDNPLCNAHFDAESEIITQYDAVHAGIATQTDNGLKVPVVQHAERLDLWQTAGEIQRVTQAARDNTAARELLSGSTISITSLGALGGIVTTPIINAPEVAIIGVNKSVERVVVENGAMTVRRIMNLSSSFDHRIIDGFDAAKLIQRMKSLLEQPATIFLANS